MFNKMLDRDAEQIKRSAYIWNSASSIAKSSQLTVFLALISRATNQGDTGIMSLAFSVSYLMRTIGEYAIRNFQATDTFEKYKFKDYFTLRIITLLFMAVSSILYVLPKGYDDEKTVTILLICLYMGIDAAEDVIHGMFQQHNRLDIAAFTEFVRYTCGMAVFAIALFVFKRLWLAAFVLVIFSMGLFCILNAPFMRVWDRMELSDDRKKIGMLLLECFPLFLSAFLSAYINNVPKSAIDKVLDNEMQGYFGMIFMPAFVVNLLSAMVYRPITVDLAREYELTIRKYVRNIKRQYLIIAGITLISILGAAVLGIPVLSLFYRVSLGEYKESLMILVFGGGVSAAISFSGTLLTIQRKQRAMAFAYGIAAVAGMFLAVPFIRRWNILGASLLYAALNIVILAVMCTIVGTGIIERLRECGNSAEGHGKEG